MMADLEILAHLSEGRKELELAEKLSRENRETNDELQLAALLGKTLLEKNEELELKLRRLQEFTEETLVANQTLSRQLNESRDSLQFANKSCEQLELKTEELEKTISGLQRLSDSKQGVIEQKNATIEDLEEKLESSQDENHNLKEQCSNLEQAGADVEATSPSKTLRSLSYTGGTPSASAEVTDLQSKVEDLTIKLRNATYQKKKIESGFREVAAENQVLSKNLEKAETEIAELQTRLQSYEEATEKQGLECSLTSPKLQGGPALTPTPTKLGSFHYQSSSPFGVESPLLLFQKPPKLGEITLGASLFSELDSEYSTLQMRYEDLLQQCTCSASLVHRSKHNLSLEPSETDGAQSTSKPEASSFDRPFKELFDEVFATLRQTAQVADKLIERKNSGKVN